MYLKIGEKQYSCTKRIKSAAGTLKFLGVSPAHGEVSGTIQMYRNDGFLMSEDDVSGYIRQKYAGTLLAFFAYPEPEPAPPSSAPTLTQRVGDLEEALNMILTGVTEDETGAETENPGV